MADFTVVPANVIAGPNSRQQSGISGATITAGMVLAKDVDGTIKPADANAAPPLQTVIGIALHGSLTGQPIIYNVSDSNFQPGYGGMSAGDAVIASALIAGNSCPDLDKAAGWFVTELGRAVDATHYKLNIVQTGVVR